MSFFLYSQRALKIWSISSGDICLLNENQCIIPNSNFQWRQPFQNGIRDNNKNITNCIENFESHTFQYRKYRVCTLRSSTQRHSYKCHAPLVAGDYFLKNVEQTIKSVCILRWMLVFHAAIKFFSLAYVKMQRSAQFIYTISSGYHVLEWVD